MEGQKPLEVLVVEDNPEFIKVAKDVYDKDSRINAHYSSTYENAIAALEKHKFDGVISDLFFPSKTDWRQKFYVQIIKNIDKLDDDWKNFWLNKGAVRRFEDLSENPSGLGIALYCLENNIPYVIVSQGERHKENLAIVRGGMRFIDRFTEIDKDPLPQILLYRGIMSGEISDKKYKSKGIIDKGEELTWRDAIYAHYTGLLARMKKL